MSVPPSADDSSDRSVNPYDRPTEDLPAGFDGEQGPWSNLYNAPPPVMPRASTRRDRKPALLRGASAVVVAAAIGGVAFWLLRPSPVDDNAGDIDTTATESASPDNAAQDKLQGMLPGGYPDGACTPITTPDHAAGAVLCEQNVDPDAPQSATYTLAADQGALDTAFSDIVENAAVVTCPGRIQSPGPWRRNATPEQISGTLVCAVQDGHPMLAWTDDAELLLGVIQSGPEGPTFDQLYAWWSSHS